MLLRAPTIFIRILLGASLAALLMPGASATGQQLPQRQGSLELRKIRHVMDGSGNLLLSLYFANQGTKPVKISGIAPSRFGPWSDVNETADAGAVIKALMKIDKTEPTTVWISTSEGLCVFHLPSRN